MDVRASRAFHPDPVSLVLDGRQGEDSFGPRHFAVWPIFSIQSRVKCVAEILHGTGRAAGTHKSPPSQNAAPSIVHNLGIEDAGDDGSGCGFRTTKKGIFCMRWMGSHCAWLGWLHWMAASCCAKNESIFQGNSAVSGCGEEATFVLSR